VPWWTQELTIKRKRLNALRLYQRTRTAEQRETRKKIYHEEKVSGSNKKGKTKIVEGILQLNTKYQSVEHSLQDSDK